MNLRNSITAWRVMGVPQGPGLAFKKQIAKWGEEHRLTFPCVVYGACSIGLELELVFCVGKQGKDAENGM